MAAPPQPVSSRIRWRFPLYVIHSRSDELFPIEPAATAVTKLQDQGNDVEFVVLDGVTHYNAGGYIEPLRAAVPWLKEKWAKGD